MSTAVVPAGAESKILDALRGMEGRATAADVAAQTGLELAHAEAGLRSLLEDRQGHLEVSESGTVVYRFDKSLLKRGHVPLVRRVGRALWKGFQQGFKLWIMGMLVVYFFAFLALTVAAVVMSSSGGGGRSRGRSPFMVGDWFWVPRWRLGRGYYGRKHEARKDERVPFYKKVFSFVFGPDDAAPDAVLVDRERTQLIRAKNGALTSTELMEYTGGTLPEAEEEMARLMAAYDGEPTVTDDGEIVYLFPELMKTAQTGTTAVAPPRAWRRLYKPAEQTGNPRGTDVFIGGLNAFNLVAAMAAPSVLLPQLGITGAAATAAFFWVPFIFSLLFFLIPLIRSRGVAGENDRRWRENVRRALLPVVYGSALKSQRTITVRDAVQWVRSAIRERDTSAEVVEEEFHKLAAEFDADVAPGADGELHFDFSAVREAYQAGEAVREAAGLEHQRLGPVVYDTEDTTEEANRRDLEGFDRELTHRRIRPPRGVRYLDDFTLRDFDRQLAPAPGEEARKLPRARRRRRS